MRMNYINTNIPTDYVHELMFKGSKGRLKAQAFLVFFFDKEDGNHSNSARFYAESWGIGKTAVNNWIKEFKHEIELFDAHWYLKNLAKTSTQFNHAKNGGGQSGQQEVDIKKAIELLNLGVLKSASGQSESTKVDKAFNNKEEVEESAIAEEFEKIFFMYSSFSNRVGDRDKGLDAYRKICKKITLEDLLSTISKYLTDASIKGQYNLQKFLSSEIFFSYLDRQMKVLIGDSWVNGRYDAKRNIFYTDETEYPFAAKVLATKMAKSEIEFLGRVA